jgi:hypothetical protein
MKKNGKNRNASSKQNLPLNQARSGGDLVGYDGIVYNRVVRSINRPLRIERRTELVDYGTIASSAAAVVAGGFTFKISDTAGYASLQSSFDQYRIIGIEFQFKALNTPTVPTTTGQCTSYLIAAVDLDSASAPAVFGDLAQFDKKSRILCTPGQTGMLAFRPSPIGDVEATAGVSPSLILKPDVWMDFADASIKYYALKYLVTQNTTTAQTRWQAMAEIIYECCSQS